MYHSHNQFKPCSVSSRPSFFPSPQVVCDCGVNRMGDNETHDFIISDDEDKVSLGEMVAQSLMKEMEIL